MSVSFPLFSYEFNKAVHAFPPPLDSVRVRIKVCKAFGIQRNASYQELLWLCTSWLCYVSGQACLKQGSFQELGMTSVNLGPKENRTVGPPRSYGQRTTIEKVMILWWEWMEFPPLPCSFSKTALQRAESFSLLSFCLGAFSKACKFPGPALVQLAGEKLWLVPYGA